MNQPEGMLPGDDVLFGRLLKKLTELPAAMPGDADRKVLRPAESLSIIEVTEELIRKLKK
ncbi:hypothetical protein EGT07_21480 [Herbaspirillum sp. HC18]|nr:hypothetical protein EGT07_21480 [Herbaspirillum sp. HC18]